MRGSCIPSIARDERKLHLFPLNSTAKLYTFRWQSERGREIMQKRIKIPNNMFHKYNNRGIVPPSPALACVMMKRVFWYITRGNNGFVYCYHLKITSFINTKQTIDDARKQKRRLSFQPVTKLFYRLFFIPIQARSQVHLVMKASPPECIWSLWVTSTEQTSRKLSTQPIILTAKCSVTPEGVENDMRQLVLVLERKKCEAITSDWHTDKWMEMW